MNIKPIGNRVIIKRSKHETQKNGLIIPANNKEKKSEGIVMAVGEGDMDKHGNYKKMLVKPGEKVLFNGYSGSIIPNEKDDDELIIMSHDDILAILK